MKPRFSTNFTSHHRQQPAPAAQDEEEKGEEEEKGGVSDQTPMEVSECQEWMLHGGHTNK